MQNTSPELDFGFFFKQSKVTLGEFSLLELASSFYFYT